MAIPSRLAFGALYIQAEEGYTDEQTRRNIQENPYLQYFCGFECYTMDSPFDASMMTHFRKRISPEMIQRINDLVFAPEAVASMDNPEEDDSVNQEDSEDTLSAQPTEESENRGTLILDATAVRQIFISDRMSGCEPRPGAGRKDDRFAVSFRP